MFIECFKIKLINNIYIIFFFFKLINKLLIIYDIVLNIINYILKQHKKKYYLKFINIYKKLIIKSCKYLINF